MPTRKFHDLVKAMPPERQQKIAKRVRDSLASMPLELDQYLTTDACGMLGTIHIF